MKIYILLRYGGIGSKLDGPNIPEYHCRHFFLYVPNLNTIISYTFTLLLTCLGLTFLEKFDKWIILVKHDSIYFIFWEHDFVRF